MERARPKKAWRDGDRGRDSSAHRRGADDVQRRQEEASRNTAIAREHRTALEALFAPKVEEAKSVAPKAAARIVLAPNPNTDPKHTERRRLLDKLLAAAGAGPISKVAEEFLAAGFVFPDEQEIYLQLLEHADETRVGEAVDALAKILVGELPKRKPVLDQRLRRIEEHAENPATRETASALRRLIHGRPSLPAAGQSR